MFLGVNQRILFLVGAKEKRKLSSETAQILKNFAIFVAGKDNGEVKIFISRPKEYVPGYLMKYIMRDVVKYFKTKMRAGRVKVLE